MGYREWYGWLGWLVGRDGCLEVRVGISCDCNEGDRLIFCQLCRFLQKTMRLLARYPACERLNHLFYKFTHINAMSELRFVTQKKTTSLILMHLRCFTVSEFTIFLCKILLPDNRVV